MLNDVTKARKARQFVVLLDSVPGKSEEFTRAKSIRSGSLGNVYTAGIYSTPLFGDLDLKAGIEGVTEKSSELQRGDLSQTATLLLSQTIALNSIVGNLAHQASSLGHECPEMSDKLLRLEFKAQAQSRVTLETLSNMKNPTTVFTRQANIANWPQQVNNVMAVLDKSRAAMLATPRTEIEQNKLEGEYD